MITGNVEISEDEFKTGYVRIDMYDQLLAENKRLREALGRIAGQRYNYNLFIVNDGGPAIRLEVWPWDIALEALEENNGK